MVNAVLIGLFEIQEVLFDLEMFPGLLVVRDEPDTRIVGWANLAGYDVAPRCDGRSDEDWSCRLTCRKNKTFTSNIFYTAE